MPEHNELTDPELHEIKGAAAATSGQIPVATGTGGAPFTAATTLFANPVYGSMRWRGNATGTTIATADTYVQIAGTSVVGPLNGVTFVSSQLTVGSDGVYQITYPFRLTQSGGASEEYQVAVGVNGVAELWGSDVVTCPNTEAVFGFVNTLVALSEDDVIYPMITNTTNDAKGCTVSHMSMSVVLLRNT